MNSKTYFQLSTVTWKSWFNYKAFYAEIVVSNIFENDIKTYVWNIDEKYATTKKLNHSYIIDSTERKKIKSLHTSMSNLFYYAYHKITCYYLLHEIPEINLHFIISILNCRTICVMPLIIYTRTLIYIFCFILFYWTII